MSNSEIGVDLRYLKKQSPAVSLKCVVVHYVGKYSMDHRHLEEEIYVAISNKGKGKDKGKGKVKGKSKVVTAHAMKPQRVSRGVFLLILNLITR